MADQDRRGGQYALSTERALRGERLAAFECIPLRSGWIVGWLIDGVRFDQSPHLRIEADTRLLIRMAAQQVAALYAISDRHPPGVLALAPHKPRTTAGH